MWEFGEKKKAVDKLHKPGQILPRTILVQPNDSSFLMTAERQNAGN